MATWTAEEKAKRIAEVEAEQASKGYVQQVDPVTGKTRTILSSAPKASDKTDSYVDYKTSDKAPSLTAIRKDVGYDATNLASTSGNKSTSGLTSKQEESLAMNAYNEQGINSNTSVPKSVVEKQVSDAKAKGLLLPESGTYTGGTVPTLATPKLTTKATPVAQKTPATQLAPVDTFDQDKLDAQGQLIDTQLQDTKSRFNTAFENAKLTLGRQQEAIDPMVQTQAGQIRTEDTMSRANQANVRAISGLGSSGAAGQDTIAQNVITSNASNALRTQALNLRADIETKLAEAQMERDQGISSAESDAEAQKLAFKLQAIEQAEADLDAATAKAEADQKAQEAQLRSDALATINASYGDFQAKINELQNDGDPTNDYLIPYYQQARQEKIANQGLDQQGKPVEQGVTYTTSQALEAYRMGIYSPEVLQTLGAAGYDVSNVTPTSGGGGGTVVPTTTPTPSPYGNAPVQQQAAYSELKDALSLGRLSGQEAINYLAKDYNTLAQRFGAEVVDQMAADINAQMNPVAEEVAPVVQTEPDRIGATDYKTSPDFASDYSAVVNSTDKAGFYQKLVANSQAFIAEYGLQGYQELLKATGQE